MDSVTTAIEKFKTILESKTSWSSLKNSQFVDHISIFTSWCLRASQWAAERAKQEFFISTALNRSSIIAHAEDREYIPRKPIPSEGVLTITNEGTVGFTVPAWSEFTSESGLTITTTDAVIVAASSSGAVSAEQKEYEEIDHEITTESSFYEILIDKDKTPKISSFQVFVDMNDGSGFEEWEYARLLQNSDSESKVFDEFYSSTDQIGIRFGDGTFGLIPPSGSTVRLMLWKTDGDVFISTTQEVQATDDVLDAGGDVAALSVVVSTAFQGGVNGEDTEQIRTSLHYWPIFNDQLVWDDDYIFFIKRRFPKITWINVWGEKEAEVQAGALSLDFINTIFVSAYADGGEDISTEIITELEDKALKMNRRFSWVEPVLATFTLTITGKVEKSRNISTIETAITNALIENYGADSQNRKSIILIKEIYSLINDLGYFVKKNEYFEIAVAGTTEATLLEEFVSIDIENTVISMSYL